MNYEKKLERWREAHSIAVNLTGSRSPDTALLTIGIMAVEAFETIQSGEVWQEQIKEAAEELAEILRGGQ
jgi:hypothetical protein